MSIADRLLAARKRITSAAQRVGRDPDAVRLVAVSKRHPASAIIEAADAGARIVGESFAQEMVAKLEEVGSRELSWHFVGRLQRNKVKLVVGRVALIHAVDSERLVREIGKRALEAGFDQRILIAVNVAGEDSKTGVPAQACRELVALAKDTAGVCCDGLMTMPPLADDPEATRPYFRALRELGTDLGLAELSMGTTGDFEVAIEEGATLVRLGTSIFGPRP